MSKTFDFPIWLKGSPEEQEAEAKRQELLRASFTRAHLTEAERLIGRGALLEQTAIGNLAKPNPLAQAQYADALAMQGKYAEAAEIHPDPLRQEHFEKIIAAIEKPDEAKCNCPDATAKMGEVDLSITPRFERDRIFSPVHGEVVSLVECHKCGHQNARPLRSRLLPQQAALNSNEAASRGTGRGPITDLDVLRS